jgi:hypothetical protein
MSNYFESSCPTCNSTSFKNFSSYLQGAPVVYAKAGPTNAVPTPYHFGAPGFISPNTSIAGGKTNYSTLGGHAYKQNVLFSAPYSARGCNNVNCN